MLPPSANACSASIIQEPQGRNADPLIAAFRGLGSSTISDALDRLEVPGQLAGIRPLLPNVGLCGRAFTVRYVPVQPGKQESVGDFIDDVPQGAVVVIDNGGRLDATVWGDLMTTVAVRNRLGGTVIDGVCRDTPKAKDLGYPIFSKTTFMRTGKDRVTLAAVGEPLQVAGHRVNQDDIVFGDADGIVVIPADAADRILEVARMIGAAEEGIRELLAAGMRLDEARKRFQYHALQSAQ